ncbi:MAG: hypothetical protein ACRYG2_13530 [Janthinobacterium lividum]
MAARFDFDKTFHGDLDAVGTGVVLGAGDPRRMRPAPSRSSR